MSSDDLGRIDIDDRVYAIRILPASTSYGLFPMSGERAEQLAAVVNTQGAVLAPQWDERDKRRIGRHVLRIVEAAAPCGDELWEGEDD